MRKRFRNGAVYGAIVVVLALGVPASANTFAAAYADSPTHTWWNGGETTWWELQTFGTIIEDLMENEYEDRTDLTAVFATWHGPNSSGWYTDISWWATDLATPLGGVTTCDKLRPGSTTLCDHWHVALDNDPQTDAQRRATACHELGHTIGFKDGDGGWCGPGSDELSSHDIWHINARY